jgi:hypothetical protein
MARASPHRAPRSNAAGRMRTRPAARPTRSRRTAVAPRRREAARERCAPDVRGRASRQVGIVRMSLSRRKVTQPRLALDRAGAVVLIADARPASARSAHDVRSRAARPLHRRERPPTRRRPARPPSRQRRSHEHSRTTCQTLPQAGPSVGAATASRGGCCGKSPRPLVEMIGVTRGRFRGSARGRPCPPLGGHRGRGVAPELEQVVRGGDQAPF